MLVSIEAKQEMLSDSFVSTLHVIHDQYTTGARADDAKTFINDSKPNQSQQHQLQLCFVQKALANSKSHMARDC